MVSEGLLLDPFSDEVQSLSNMAFGLQGRSTKPRSDVRNCHAL